MQGIMYVKDQDRDRLYLRVNICSDDAKKEICKLNRHKWHMLKIEFT